MEEVLKAILETESIELRMRPAYFPFVEPGLEIDAKVEV
jgi:phenylalanyl-tRNA synthetase alpha subunit